MTEMDFELLFFRLVLKYWIASHNVDFPLLEDGLTEKLATYDGNKLVWKKCFKRCENPTLKVDKTSIRAYLTFDMRDRMNDFVPQVGADIKARCEYLQNEMIQIDAKGLALNNRSFWSEADQANYNQLECAYIKAQSEFMQLSYILNWFRTGLPRFIKSSYDKTDFWVYLIHS